jgi:hypothetical protein
MRMSQAAWARGSLSLVGLAAEEDKTRGRASRQGSEPTAQDRFRSALYRKDTLALASSALVWVCALCSMASIIEFSQCLRRHQGTNAKG